MPQQAPLPNKYSLHTKVNYIVSDELDEYCNCTKQDHSTAIRNFIEAFLQKWRDDNPANNPRKKADLELYRAYKSTSDISDRNKTLLSIYRASESLFADICREYGIDPQNILDQYDPDTNISKRDQCRSFLRGLLTYRDMERSEITAICRLEGFTDDQVEKSLPEVAVYNRTGKRHIWSRQHDNLSASLR